MNNINEKTSLKNIDGDLERRGEGNSPNPNPIKGVSFNDTNKMLVIELADGSKHEINLNSLSQSYYV